MTSPNPQEGGKHTPGEWRVEFEGHYQGHPHLTGANIITDNVLIAEVRGAVAIDGRPHQEHLANAHLIAAAPALLEAGLRYFAAMDKLRDASVQSLSRDDPRFAAVAETRAALRAALLQATGGDNGR